MDLIQLVIAQLPDPLWTGLTQAGLFAPVLGYFMWRDTKRDEKLEQITESINHLTRALALEVLSRPNVVERAKTEANDILKQIGPGGR